jgi:hypothetical protein
MPIKETAIVVIAVIKAVAIITFGFCGLSFEFSEESFAGVEFFVIGSVSLMVFSLQRELSWRP